MQYTFYSHFTKNESHFYCNTLNNSWLLKTKQNAEEYCEEAPNNKTALVHTAKT